MYKFSACIDMMYRAETRFEARVLLAAADSVAGIEFWKWSNKDLTALKAALDGSGMKAVLSNLDSRDETLSAALSRGIVAAGRTDELIRSIRESAPVMHALGMNKAIVLAGDADPALPFEAALENAKETLFHAARAAADEGLTLLFEPLNTYDRPSYVMPYSETAFDIVKSVDSANLKVLFDIYHAQRMEGNLVDTIRRNIAHIGHFHVANSPYRCEPDSGEIDYAYVLSEIGRLDYGEWIGFEYIKRSEAFSLGEYIKKLGGIRR